MYSGRNALISWLLTLSFSFLYLSDFLSRRVEGQVATPSELGVAILVLLSAGRHQASESEHGHNSFTWGHAQGPCQLHAKALASMPLPEHHAFESFPGARLFA